MRSSPLLNQKTVVMESDEEVSPQMKSPPRLGTEVQQDFVLKVGRNGFRSFLGRTTRFELEV